MKELADCVTDTVLKLAPASHANDAVKCFFYQTIRTFFVLASIVFTVAGIPA